MRPDQLAAQTWDRDEPVEETSHRIHDGADDLRARADSHVADLLLGSFPQAVPSPAADILEIGSGLGWIMEAMNGYLCGLGVPPQAITGLDIAPKMLAKARLRLGDGPPYRYQIYDGLEIPFPDGSFDLIYSIASLQHVPRPFVFNLFFEIKRLLRKPGFAVLHFLSTDCLRLQEAQHPWRKEIDNQVQGRETHWHHFYTAKELTDVLSITGFPYVAVKDDGAGTLIASVSGSPLSLPSDFDAAEYLRLNQDVRKAGEDPVSHYLAHGHGEGRKWFTRRRLLA